LADRRKRGIRKSPAPIGSDYAIDALMDSRFYMLFETSLGRCGLAWGDGGVIAASFPDESDEKTRGCLLRRAPDAEEVHQALGEISRVIDEIRALFTQGNCDFSSTRLDMTRISEFDRAVYDFTLTIKPGETRTYGDLARALGDVSLSRGVGQSLGRNPIPIIVPCHRVLGANGAMTGFSAPGGTDTKRRLLKIEGALAPDLFDVLD
jgi:methylated-DNA-[protein]-cysteine S-methyltransferase